MKTKLTFLTLAIVALLGVGMLMAFKQEEKPKQYLNVHIYNSEPIAYDENNNKIDLEQLTKKMSIEQMTNKIINHFSKQGYKLLSASPAMRTSGSGGYITSSPYIFIVFEKE